jgi:hypothetical protein
MLPLLLSSPGRHLRLLHQSEAAQKVERWMRDVNAVVKITAVIIPLLRARLLSSEPWSPISYQVYSEEGADNVI